MITIYTKYQSEHLKELVVKGHANFAKKGSDIVCSAVSCAVFGLLNALDENKVSIDICDNEISVNVLTYDLKHDNYFSLFIIQMKTIAEGFSKYIEIHEIGRSKNHDEI